MILNLYADSPKPQEFTDQINASLVELAQGLNEAIVGDVITFNGPGTYTHALGVKPLIGLVTVGDVAGMSGYPITISEEKSGDWGETSVYIGDVYPAGPPYTFMQVLLIGKP